MTEVRFYHLQTQTLEQALPKLLVKAFSTGQKILVKALDTQAVEALNTHLWTFHPNYFLPHGSQKDGHAAQQPIWLTAEDDNPNGAALLFLTDGVSSTLIDQMTLCCDVFNGADPQAVQAARQRWKTYKEAAYDLTYWQQAEDGSWTQK